MTKIICNENKCGFEMRKNVIYFTEDGKTCKRYFCDNCKNEVSVIE